MQLFSDPPEVSVHDVAVFLAFGKPALLETMPLTVE